MEKFIGTGYLLDCSNYKSKLKDVNGKVILDKDGKFTLVEKIKYSFLVGDQDSAEGFMSSPHIEITVVDADKPILDEVSFMLPVRVAVEIKNNLEQINGKWQEVPKPTYTLVGNVE